MRATLMLLFGAIALWPDPAAAQRRVPDLSGTWVLRVDSSRAPSRTPPDTLPPDTVSADSVPTDSMEAVPPDSIRPREPGNEGRARRPAVRRDPKDLRQVQLLRGMAQPVPSFTLEQSDSTLVVTNEDGFTYTVPLNGRQATIPLTDSTSVEVRAKWEDRALVVEYRPTGGGKLVEAYHLADSGLYLRLEVTVEHKALFRPDWEPRMYRKVEPGS